MNSPPTAHGGHARWAYLLHRVSGIGLALFLPVHFFVLGLALQGEARLEAAIAWTRHPLVQFAEWAITVCLFVHLAGGIRLLASEWQGRDPARPGPVIQALLASLGFALVLALVLALGGG